VSSVSNFTSKNNPPWVLAESARPVRPPGPEVPDQAAAAAAAAQAGSGSPCARFGRILLIVGQVLLSWLAAIPRRLGDRLFFMNDTEACWRGWQLTKTQGGLRRRYRDPRFGTLAECPKCRGTGPNGTGGAANLPCLPCLGTGRVTLGEVS
jgi:hypothetical protein